MKEIAVMTVSARRQLMRAVAFDALVGPEMSVKSEDDDCSLLEGLDGGR